MIALLKAKINFLRMNLRFFFRKHWLGLTTPKRQIAHLQQQVNCSAAWYGSSYGGFYIYPDLIGREAIIYSFGIGKDITFDLSCIKRHGCQVFGFDPTPKSIDYIQRLRPDNRFHFYEYGIGVQSGLARFFLPKNTKAVSGSMEMITGMDESNSMEVPLQSFKDITKALGHQRIDVIKMDIEGAEYEVLPTLLSSGLFIGQILVEFHDRMYPNSDRPKSTEVVEQLKKAGFVIFAASTSFEEISFINQQLLR